MGIDQRPSGVVFNAIAYILAIDSIGSYLSTAADDAVVMLIFGGLFLLIGAILLMVDGALHLRRPGTE